jgi:hypothetical protein
MKDHSKKGSLPEHIGTGKMPAHPAFEKLVKETNSQLYAEHRYRDFFSGFTEDSVHDFIAEYAVLRSWYTVNGPNLRARKEREAFRFQDLAIHGLWEIQQKKLFNLQAEWRAGLISIPGVAVSAEIAMWEKSISTCPFIEPVTQAECNLYLDYLASGTFSDKSWVFGWQDYDSFRNCGPELMPAWYNHYDKANGTGYLLVLPDKQGVIEQNALRTFQAAFKTGPHHPADNNSKPELSFNYESLHFFIRNFETPRLLDCFLSNEQRPEETERDAELHAALRVLQSAEGSVALPESADWRESVIRGAADYKALHVARSLRHMYNDYLFRLSTGIAPASPHDDPASFAGLKAMAELMRHQVEEGSKLSG